MEGKHNVAIIGNGCAGAECIKALREKGYTGKIHLFADNKWPVTNPMLTTYYVGGKIGFEGLFPYGNKGELYNTYEVNVHLESPVVNLDTKEQVIKNQAGFELKYDQCLIASGASPFLPPIPGIGSNKVFVMRAVEDALRLKETLDQKPQKALVIGASMVGIKVVEVLHKAGLDVTLADLAQHIFPLAAHLDCARIIEERLRKMGIKLRFNAGLKEVEETPVGIKAYFTNSTEPEEADLLVMCIGVRANSSFINREEVEVQQGVLVDQYMKTNVPGLYAAGDVAQGKNLLSGRQQTIGLWANARYQGRTAGVNMAGIPETFPGNILHNITHFMGMDFVGIGDVQEYTRMEQKWDGKRFIQLFWQDKLLSGVNFIDDYSASGVFKSTITKRLLQHNGASDHSFPMMQNVLIKSILMEVEKE